MDTAPVETTILNMRIKAFGRSGYNIEMSCEPEMRVLGVLGGGYQRRMAMALEAFNVERQAAELFLDPIEGGAVGGVVGAEGGHADKV